MSSNDSKSLSRIDPSEARVVTRMIRRLEDIELYLWNENCEVAKVQEVIVNHHAYSGLPRKLISASPLQLGSCDK